MTALDRPDSLAAALGIAAIYLIAVIVIAAIWPAVKLAGWIGDRLMGTPRGDIGDLPELADCPACSLNPPPTGKCDCIAPCGSRWCRRAEPVTVADDDIEQMIRDYYKGRRS